MIERYVFIKLTADYATAEGRAEVLEQLGSLASIAGVQSLKLGAPADEGAAAAWDVSCVLGFRDLESVATYVRDPDHRELVDSFLAPRVAAIKAWNFEV